MTETELEITRGDDPTLTVAVTDGGQAVDISGAYLRFTAKLSLDEMDEDAAFVKTSDDGISLVNDGSDGLASIAIDAADTAGFGSATTLLWDLQVTAGGKTRTPARGTLRVVPDVSVTAP